MGVAGCGVKTGLILIQAATVLPTDEATAKLFARIDHNVDDALVTAFIQSAVEKVQDYIRGALLEQTWELVLDAFPCEEIELPLPPLIEVTSVKYIDADGVEQTLDEDVYQVVKDAERGRFSLAPGQTWPSTKCGINAAVRIRFKAGYGTVATAVPRPIVEAIWKLVAVSNRHRDETGPDKMSLIDAILSEIDPYVSRRY